MASQAEGSMELMIRVVLSAGLALPVLAGPAPKPTTLACTGVAETQDIATDRMTGAIRAHVTAVSDFVDGEPANVMLAVDRAIGGRWPAHVRWSQDPGCGRSRDLRVGQRVVVAKDRMLVGDPPILSIVGDALWRVDRSGRVLDRWLAIDGKRAPATAVALERVLRAGLGRTRPPDPEANLRIEATIGTHRVRGDGSPLSRHTVAIATADRVAGVRVRADGSGDWSACLPSALAVGDEVTLRVGDRSRSLRVPMVTAAVDWDADVVSGTAPRDGEVHVDLWWDQSVTAIVSDSVFLKGRAGPDGRYAIPVGKESNGATVQSLLWQDDDGDTVTLAADWLDQTTDCFLPDTSTVAGPADPSPTPPVSPVALVLVGSVALLVALRRRPGTTLGDRRHG